MAIFTHVAGRRDGQRHLIQTVGADAYPHGLCGAPVRLVDDELLLACTDCRAKALGETAVALDVLGLPDLAARVARVAGDLSFMTRRAQVDADPEWAMPRAAGR